VFRQQPLAIQAILPEFAGLKNRNDISSTPDKSTVRGEKRWLAYGQFIAL